MSTAQEAFVQRYTLMVADVLQEIGYGDNPRQSIHDNAEFIAAHTFCVLLGADEPIGTVFSEVFVPIAKKIIAARRAARARITRN